eukprot:4513452-Pyramimonas_sp.AAC.1
MPRFRPFPPLPLIALLLLDWKSNGIALSCVNIIFRRFERNLGSALDPLPGERSTPDAAAKAPPARPGPNPRDPSGDSRYYLYTV